MLTNVWLSAHYQDGTNIDDVQRCGDTVGVEGGGSKPGIWFTMQILCKQRKPFNFITKIPNSDIIYPRSPRTVHETVSS